MTMIMNIMVWHHNELYIRQTDGGEGYTTIEVDVDDADNDEDEEDEDEDDEEDDEEEYEDAEDGEEEEEDDDDDDGDTHFEEIEVEVGNAGAAEDDATPARGRLDGSSVSIMS